MADRRSSTTAVSVAYYRAAHRLFDDPLILDDTIIASLLGVETLENIRSLAEHLQTRGSKALRAHIVLRSRFAEDRLEHAVARGVRQYVMLGAGLDTFAFRQPHWAHGIRIFEVDHPASQQAKRDRLATAGIEVPANLTFAAIDLEHEPLRESLARHGVDLAQPVFISWLGVMMYLTPDAADAVFQTVCTLAPSSEIAFTFAPRVQPGDPLHALAQQAAAAGEPWHTFVDPPELASRLRDLGFAEVYFLSVDDSEAQYFQGRTDLPAPRRVSIGAAIV
jgi:methyltransferase (TIGR00027 family)